MKVAIIVAMDREYSQLEPLFRDDENVRVYKAGIGKVNAAVQTLKIIEEFKPYMIISSGCAGGHGEDVRPKDVVMGTEMCYHDVWCGYPNKLGQVQDMPERFKISDDVFWVDLKELEDCGVNIHKGLIVTGDWFVDTKEKMQEIVDNFPDVKAVDMESAAIAQVCWKEGVGFVSFRVISDCPLSGDNVVQYDKFWDEIADNSFEVTRKFVDCVKKEFEQ